MKLGWNCILISKKLLEGFQESKMIHITWWKQWSLVGQILWGYVKSDGSKKMVKIDGNLNSTKYIQLLKYNLILHLDEGEIFQ